MLTIICGEDIISSRNHFLSLKKEYREKGFEPTELTVDDVLRISDLIADSISLFSLKKVYFIENINKQLSRKTDLKTKNIFDQFKKIEKMNDVELIIWEGLSQRELKFSKTGKIKEFKPDQNIFKLLDLIYPGNLNMFISRLNSLSRIADENFIFFMLLRHIRNMILINEDKLPPRMQSWQIYKFKKQLKYWKRENLVNFYQALFKIEMASKTSTSPFSIKESLEILACHFL